MRRASLDAEPRGELIQAAAGRRAPAVSAADSAVPGAGIHQMRQIECVQPQPAWDLRSERGGCRVEHGEVVAEAVVSDHGPVADPSEETAQCFPERRRTPEVAVFQTRQLRDALRESAFRPHQSLESVELAAMGNGDGPDLDYLMLRRARPVGVRLQVEDHMLGKLGHRTMLADAVHVEGVVHCGQLLRLPSSSPGRTKCRAC